MLKLQQYETEPSSAPRAQNLRVALRRFLADIAEDITDGLDTVNVVARGNTFAIHLEGATINISVNTAREGGEA